MAASSISCRCCRTSTKKRARRDARVLMMTMHSAKGLEFPVVVITGLEEGLCSRIRGRRRTKRSSRRNGACATSASRARSGGWCSRRRPGGACSATTSPRDPSRFIDEIPAELLEEVPSTFVDTAALVLVVPRHVIRARCSGYRGRAREEHRVYNYEDEDQSLPARPQARAARAASRVRPRHDP